MDRQINYINISEWKENEISPKDRLIVPEIIDRRVLNKLYKNRNSKEVINAITEKTKVSYPNLSEHELMKRVKANRTRTNSYLKNQKEFLAKPYKNSTNFLEYKACYVQSPGYGRMYAEGCISVFFLSRKLRATMIRGIYDDVDIVNAHPNFLLSYLEKYPKELTFNRELKEYIDNRDDILKECKEKLGWSRDRAKMEFLRYMNGGGNEEECYQWGEKYKFVNDYYKSMKLTIIEMEKLANHTDFKNKHFSKAVAKDKQNRGGTVSNRFFMYAENQVLQVIAEEMVKKNVTPGPLCYDGILVQKNFLEHQGVFDQEPSLKNTDLRDIEETVREKTGFKIQLINKQIPEGLKLEDVSEKKQPPTDYEYKNEFVDIISEKGCFYLVGDRVAYFSQINQLWKMTSITLEIGVYASEILQEHYRENLQDVEVMETYLSNLQSASKMNSLGSLIRLDERLRVDITFIEKFNRSFPHYLPITGGNVINLKTCEVLERKQEHFFTYEIQRPFEVDNKNIKKIENIFREYMKFSDDDGNEHVDEEQFISLKRSIAYSMTSSVEHKKFFLLQGETSTGKSTLFNILRKALQSAELCTSVSPALICEDRVTGIQSYHQVLESGARMAYCSEFDKSMKINNSCLKRLTGDDVITFRPMKEAERKYNCSAKVWLFTNQTPNMDVIDRALMNRLVTYHFRKSFENPTEQHKKSLKWITNKSDDVFAYLCLLCKDYYAEGANIPISESMEKLKQEIIKEIDPLANFRDRYRETYTQEELESMSAMDRKDKTGTELIGIMALYSEYLTVCRERGERKNLSKKEFDGRVKILFPSKVKCDFLKKKIRYKCVLGYANIEEDNTGFHEEDMF